VHVLEDWQQARLGEFTVTAVPARHGVPEITYVIQSGGTPSTSAATR
jgi:hypothetical protein